jgi:predicted ATPase with chaperone activity
VAAPVPVAAAVEVAEVVLLDELLELVEAADALVMAGALGTVNGGAPAVLVVFEPAEPQAATPMAITAAAATAAGLGLRDERDIRGVGRTLRSPGAPCACRNAGSR